MIEKRNLFAEVKRRMAVLAVGEHIDIRSYKRDRSVVVVKLAEGRYRLIENGFEQDDSEIDADELRATLKVLQKREFPRSNKLRIYEMGVFDELERAPQRQHI